MARPKGSKNIKSFNAEILATKLKVDPVEILLRMAAGDWKGLGYDSELYFKETESGAIKAGYVITPNMRLDAATQACKYLYSTKQSVKIEGGKEPIRMIVEEYKPK